MAGERLFIVRTASGEELEPADENTLVRWAEEGRITLECKIRSTMVPNWENAIELPCLKPILKKRLVERIEQQHDTFMNRVMARINLRYEDFSKGDTNGLNKEDPAAQPTAEIWLRIAAGLTDAIFLFIIGVVYHLICAWLFTKGILKGNNVFYIGFIAYWITILGYYMLNITLRTQTPGQHFWGIYLVRNSGQDFWIGRVFFYFLFMIPFGLFTPIFVYVTSSGRSLQEILTKTRMVKIVFDENRRKRK